MANKRTKSKGVPRKYRPGNEREREDDKLQGVFAALMRSAADLTKVKDPLDAEMFVSQTVAMWENAGLFDADAEQILGLGAVRWAADEGSERALALLVGLVALGGPRVARRAATEVSKLTAAGRERPQWADAVGNASFIEAWVAEHEFGDADMIGMVFSHEGWEPHALGVLIDHNLNSMAKDVLVATDAGGLRSAWEEIPETTIRSVTAQDVATRLAAGLEAEGMYLEAPSTEELKKGRALIRSRLRGLPQPRPLQRPIMDDASRDQLEREFTEGAEARGLDRDALEDIVFRIIGFSCDYGCGDPLRWSPTVVELFMTDWLPRKALLEGPPESVPDVMRAWVRFAGRKRGVSQGSVQEAVESVARWEKEMLGAMEDPSRQGHAKAIVSALMDEGIDPTDQAAVNAWMEDFNSRPEEARKAVLG